MNASQATHCVNKSIIALTGDVWLNAEPSLGSSSERSPQSLDLLADPIATIQGMIMQCLLLAASEIAAALSGKCGMAARDNLVGLGPSPTNGLVFGTLPMRLRIESRVLFAFYTKFAAGVHRRCENREVSP